MFILDFFAKWGLIASFLFVILEYACFPIPSEVVLPFIGFISSLNGYSKFGVILFSVIMGYLGCLICYLVGYYGGNKIYNIIYNKFNKWQHGLDKAKKNFNKYGNVSVFICRLIPLCRTYISFFAGMFRQGLFKYSFYSILGILIWNTILIMLGCVFMDKWGLISIYYNKYRSIILYFILIFILFILVYKLYKKIKLTKTINGD